ncbi:MAG: J domain-containing protein [Desulfuromonadales bacterium]|nr:J domain-containing protein [Desulfuromonadales bacterium]
MSVTFQDYYKTLGVDKDASQETIQRAYRKLARKYHPDINKAHDAEEKFKQINEAYEVLGDPEKRTKYDQVGSSWNSGFESYGSAGGENVHFSFNSADPGQFSDFFQNLFGGRWNFGEGNDRWGSGGQRRRGRDQEARIDISLSEAYHGARKSIEMERIETDADGRPQKAGKSYEVTIPPGMTEGSLIRISEQGGRGSGGAEAGDLYLRIHILPDPRFTINGHDLATSIDIAPWEAALGAKVPVATVDGRINLNIPAGTQSGLTLRVRGKGMPVSSAIHGDLLVTVRIVVPKPLSTRERQLFEELARESRFDARK